MTKTFTYHEKDVEFVRNVDTDRWSTSSKIIVKNQQGDEEEVDIRECRISYFPFN